MVSVVTIEMNLMTGFDESDTIRNVKQEETVEMIFNLNNDALIKSLFPWHWNSGIFRA